MFPIAFSIIRYKFPPEKLAIAQGIFSSTLSGGAVIGLDNWWEHNSKFWMAGHILIYNTYCNNTFCDNPRICSH